MFEIALALIPLFLLVGCLLFGRYPGLNAIVRLAERLSRRVPVRPRSQRRPRAPRARPLSGGLLLAYGFAQRPPPVAP
ncbi:MAG TPA: hypothetical protein VF085_11675 [Solirubrobacterales bacterium]